MEGLLSDYIFLDSRLTGGRYLQFLSSKFWGEVRGQLDIYNGYPKDDEIKLVQQLAIQSPDLNVDFYFWGN